MVNKAFLSLAAVVLFAVFGTGVFVGMQVGGLSEEGPDGPEASETSPETTDTQVTSTPSGSDSTTEPSDDSDVDDEDIVERETIPPREFNERNISASVVESINDAREAEGLERLSTTGSTAEDLRLMAGSHSDAMADAGLVRHTIDGLTSTERYEQYGLYDTCQFQVESYIENADNNDLEVIGRTYAGQNYPDNGTQRFNENDTEVGNALTEDWLSTPVFEDRLLLPNAGRIGVGVTVTNTGSVYATVNICS
ncbi:CAP domain-containing protein [Haloarcula salinisoli]|uniref:CAP domain-containing protein n=1 Tax=Haloarcula salinisoli TaxID=2487746 RepID=A0A8J7YKE2_9EURY|nr:CAP domain-containing protein [Halomicroarcula salinisoli]MBX0285699.1 CAP domain-containing protein [Halomicroarcula salinisoli]MBX0302813.1 CAP domain-containing protein [Halomicroarcula salinisoli]